MNIAVMRLSRDFSEFGDQDIAFPTVISQNSDRRLGSAVNTAAEADNIPRCTAARHVYAQKQRVVLER